MQDTRLLRELLEAESEEAVIAVLDSRGLLGDLDRWVYLGNMPNNQSIVQAQQSTAAAALVEKYTNGADAVLLRKCKALKVDPRGADAPLSMSKAVNQYFGELAGKDSQEIRRIAEDNLILYATGSKRRPCISFYDGGEGQFAHDFPTTFCSLIYGSDSGSYKGAIPFVQGRFNMGGTGVLPFCSERRKLQLILSRVPDEIAGSSRHEWAFTLFAFFPDAHNPSWRYLVGSDKNVLTAGTGALKLIPEKGLKAGVIPSPRSRLVSCGTLIKMYDYKAPRSNVCGELFKKLTDYLLRPALPLRIYECRPEYRAKVMAVTVWDRLDNWGKNKFEEGFEDGASLSIKLSTSETVPAEVFVFRSKAGELDGDLPQTGLRALINGQSHAKRDVQFFKTKAVDKEHIAGSMLVALDCTELGQASRNAMFMSNRETFRDDPLLNELFKKLQKELRNHEGLQELNLKRYQEKIENATDDDDGVAALEELLSTDPELAELFGSLKSGKVAAKTAKDGRSGKVPGIPQPFIGMEFPTYFERADGTTSVAVDLPQGRTTRVSFKTDVKNNYFSRRKHRGECQFANGHEPTLHLFNGRLTFSWHIDPSTPIGTALKMVAVITDKTGRGPFTLTVNGTVVSPPAAEPAKPPRPKPEPKGNTGPSKPDIREVPKDPDDPPITIEKVPNSDRLQLMLNTNSRLLEAARNLRPDEEAAAVEFVFKYGLALTVMGLLDAATKTPEWKNNEADVRAKIERSAEGIARVIVPLCLSLPKKLPKPIFA